MTPNIPPVNEEMKKFIHGLLTHMVKNKGSDLFITAGYPPAMKLDGKLTKITDKPLTAEHTQQIARSIMDDKQAEEFFTTNECNFAISLAGVSRFRINAMVQRGATALVCRVITSEIPQFENMHLPPVLKQVVMEKRGLVIFVGGTGSGKSTSLAAMIGYRNANSYGHIITIEDPIEFVHQSKKALINQRELHQHTHSFTNALRSALREDPDVILIGEMRDPETISLALTAAETGHLVFGTLHTTGAAKTIDRIVDVFPAGEKEIVRSMLSESLRAIISQTLLKTRDGNGRVAAHEILISTPAVRNLIRENKIAQINAALQTGQAHGMQTLDQALQTLVRQGTISPELARSKAQNIENLSVF